MSFGVSHLDWLVVMTDERGHHYANPVTGIVLITREASSSDAVGRHREHLLEGNEAHSPFRSSRVSRRASFDLPRIAVGWTAWSSGSGPARRPSRWTGT